MLCCGCRESEHARGILLLPVVQNLVDGQVFATSLVDPRDKHPATAIGRAGQRVRNALSRPGLDAGSVLLFRYTLGSIERPERNKQYVPVAGCHSRCSYSRHRYRQRRGVCVVRVQGGIQAEWRYSVLERRGIVKRQSTHLMTLESISMAVLGKPGNAKVICASGHCVLQWRLGRHQEHHSCDFLYCRRQND